jgi:A/G-specific adenine glycosylase
LWSEVLSTRRKHDPVKALLKWYSRYGRHDLPWRVNRTPYRVLLSEFLLQQTQVSRGIEYFRLFLRHYPSLKALAQASEQEVLNLWQGLGYYSRARNLFKAAKIIRQQYGGRVPKDDQTLQSLPGVGEYTSAAVLSFAFGQRAIALDTNLRRVAERYFRSGKVVSELDSWFAKISAAKSYQLNYALMDIGSSICTARKAVCDRCPLAKAGCSSAFQVISNVTSVKKSGSSAISATHIYSVGELFEGREPVLSAIGKAVQSRPLSHDRKSDSRATLKAHFKEQFGLEVAVRPPYKEERSGSKLILFCRCRRIGGRALDRVFDKNLSR